MIKERIYIKTWLELKPYEKQAVTDPFYLNICNDVKGVFTANKLSLVLQSYLDKKYINYLSCFITSYLEDIISETNIWNSFVKTHQRLYQKQLPFYVLDEYYEEEINPQDISFLIWYFFNSVQEKKFIAPYTDIITETAEKIMEVFDKAWDYAPQNEHLKSIYQIDENEENYYVARNLIDTILFKTYLFYPDTFLKLRKQELEIIEANKDDENLAMILYENSDRYLHKTRTRLLSQKGKEWASEILGKNHILSKSFLSISQRVGGFFFYKGQDDYDIFIEHIASGKKFKLTKKSFDNSDDLEEVDTILFMAITQWKDEWWFSGIFFKHPFNPDLVLDEKNSIESRMVVSFLDHQKTDTDEALNKQNKAFLDFNKGLQIAFMESEKIEYFIRDYTKFYNNSLNLSAKEKEESKQRAQKDGFFGVEEEHMDYAETSETGLVFFNPKRGVEIALEVNSAFPLTNNPFFDVEKSEDNVIFLLVSKEISTELALFCIDNCKNELSFFKGGIGKMYLEDINFLLRFWKKENYHSKPSITYTGLEEK